MTAHLARRLVWDGLVDEAELDRALHSHVVGPVPLLCALVSARPELLAELESGLGPMKDVGPLAADPSLLSRLPPGLPQGLLVLPLGLDGDTGRVRVATADPLDPHVREELEHHLGTSVVMIAAPLRALLAALDAKAPVSGPPRMSEPPIPLVRLSADRAASPHTVKGVAPPAGTITAGAPAQVVVTSPVVPIVEPVIELTRRAPRSSPTGAPPEGAPGSEPPGTLAGIAAAGSSPEAALPPSSDPRRDATEIEASRTADEVAERLVRGLSRSRHRVLVFAVRGKVFEGKDASDDAARGVVRSLVISADRPSLLLTAAQAGEYRGPVPRTAVHQPLIELLGAGTVIAFAVTVSARAALVCVLGGGPEDAPVEHALSLGGAATRALERIVRMRKK